MMAAEHDVLGRIVPPKPEKEKPDLTVLTQYVNRLLEYARPDDMLRAIGAVSPDTTVRITYKGSPHVEDVLKNTAQFRSPVPVCCCGMPDGSHLCTTSLAWIPDQYADVKRMLEKGLNHVPCSELDVEAVCDVHATVADAVAGASFVPLARAWAQQALSAAAVIPVDVVQFTRQHPGVQYILRRCFVSCVDKACNQPMFICRHLALTMALQHCVDTPSFELQELSPDPRAIAHELKCIAPVLPMPPVDKDVRFATLYPVVKLHKTPIGWRMITSAVGTLLHNAAVLLQATTARLIEELQGYCALRNASLRSYHGFNVQCCPLIKDGRVCLANVDPRQQYLCDYSADVDHCFDIIPHDSLLSALESVSNMLSSAYSQNHRGQAPRFNCSGRVTDGVLEVTSVHFTHRKPTSNQFALSLDSWLQLCRTVVATTTTTTTFKDP